MAGQLEKGRIRQLGPGQAGDLGTVSRERSLIIFRDPLFSSADHGVRNKEFIPGRNPTDFVGLDSLGWGIHPNGEVNVVDPNECRNGFGIKTENICWATLWKLERNEEENRNAQGSLKDGYRMFLDRMIKTVSLSKTDVQMIPDPRIWMVAVNQKNTEALGPNVVGKLIPWPRFTPDGDRLRKSTFELRDVNVEFQGREDQKWPRGRSPAQ